MVRYPPVLAMSYQQRRLAGSAKKELDQNGDATRSRSRFSHDRSNSAVTTYAVPPARDSTLLTKFLLFDEFSVQWHPQYLFLNQQ